uniref:Uncharacterized protein n=1 Tax=Arundo donax TaxID=35708 RepID=A0A0A9C9V0_ARUDO
MVLLMSERFYHTEAKVVALMLTTFIDLASLVGAYIAGTTRYFSSCIYIIVIICVAFVGVIYIGEVMAEICKFFLNKLPCMFNLAQLKWFPVPAEVVKSAMQDKEQQQHEAEERNRQQARSNKQHCACSPCCGTRADVSRAMI